jgi:hypothetical protein
MPMTSFMTFDISIIVASFVLVFIAELGDKTQITAFSLTSTSRHPVIIFFAASLALTLSSVLAAVLGAAASQVIPQYTAYIAVALFFAFGVYILFSKEAPPIKNCFLKTITLETSLLRLVPAIFKRAGIYNDEVTAILKEESSHAGVFRVLLREKRLFTDDINKDEQLTCLQDELSLSKKIVRLPFTESIKVIIKKEEAVRAMYQYFHDHVSTEHHGDDDLAKLLAELIAEETQHIAFFKKWQTEEEK